MLGGTPTETMSTLDLERPAARLSPRLSLSRLLIGEGAGLASQPNLIATNTPRRGPRYDYEKRRTPQRHARAPKRPLLGRITVTEHTGAGDVNTRKRVDLKTDNKSTAKRALAKLVVDYAAGSEPEPEAVRAHARTIDSYATAWLESRKARGVASASYEGTLYRRVWKPVLGQLPLGTTGRVSLVRDVLDNAACGKLMPPVRLNRKAKPRPYSR
jgi:hypothetical protein